MAEIHQMSISQLSRAIRSRELSCKEITQAYLRRIDRQDDRIHAFLQVEGEAALQEAESLDRAHGRGGPEFGLLTGIPLAVKDNIITRAISTTCASRILRGYRPPYDATVVQRLKEEKAVLLGKTNCDEFAMGSSTENSAYGPTRNPWDLERVPGGSSGGSAAGVAAGLMPAALGSDTGGSIRQPAAFCGIVGLKPTYGRVSRYGLVAFASSLDQIGPMARNVEDTARVLQVVAGYDERDSTSVQRPPGDYLEEIGKDPGAMRIGVVQQWAGSGLDPLIGNSVLEAVRKLEGLGCSVEEVSLPHSEYAIAVYYIIAPAEASSNLARYDGVRYGYRLPEPDDLETMYSGTRSLGFGEEVKRRIMLGTYVLSSGYYDAYYLQAGKVRRLIWQDHENAFEKVDVLIGPTTPTLPFRLGEKMADPLAMYLSDIYTVTANLAGLPALSMPCGFSEQGLPIGLQITGPHFEEGKILRLAHALEQELDLSRPVLDVDRAQI